MKNMIHDHPKCKTSNCYKVGTVYGFCLVCWNRLSVAERNRAVRAAANYGKWQLGELKENLLTQLEIQNAEGVYCHPDMDTITQTDVFHADTYGMYFPPKDRVFYSNCLDVKNDGIFSEASVSLPADSNFHLDDIDPVADGIQRSEEWLGVNQTTIYIRKIKAPPKGFMSTSGGDWYILLYGKYCNDLSSLDSEKDPYLPKIKGIFYEKSIIKIDWVSGKTAVALKSNWRIKKNFSFINQLRRRVHSLVCLAVSAEADSKYLWHVRAFRKVQKKYLQGNVRFGVYGEHVKSLFFARDLPLTETGRKRPILHWVSAHKRRIREGYEIDIDKYLRGTRLLTIGDTDFIITRPCENDDYDFKSWARVNNVGIAKQ